MLHPFPLIVTTLALVLGLPLPAKAADAKAGAQARPAQLHAVHLKTAPGAQTKAALAKPKAPATSEHLAEDQPDDYASCGCSGN